MGNLELIRLAYSSTMQNKSKYIYIIIILQYAQNILLSQTIQNLEYNVKNRCIIIDYDLIDCALENRYDIHIRFESNFGEVIEPKYLCGSYKEVLCGNDKRIVWQVYEEYEELQGNYKVILTPYASQGYDLSEDYLDLYSKLEYMSKEELRLERNRVFAKYGYIFKTSEFKLYFSSQPWYFENSRFSNDDLSLNDEQLVNIIKCWENSNDILFKSVDTNKISEFLEYSYILQSDKKNIIYIIRNNKFAEFSIEFPEHLSSKVSDYSFDLRFPDGNWALLTLYYEENQVQTYSVGLK